ncbi:hypothetical protein GCM10010520_55020 [Rhizobium viscosum]
MFLFTEQGILVNPDPSDNPDSHHVPSHEAGTQINFQVMNIGDEDGVAEVGVELDGNFVTQFSSNLLPPGGTEVGFVSLGRLETGTHTVLVFVNPGAGTADHLTNTFDVI